MGLPIRLGVGSGVNIYIYIKAPSTPLSFVCNAKPKWSKVKQIHHTNSQLEAPCLRPPPSLPRLTGVRESQGSQGGPRPRLAGEHLGHHPPSSSFPPAFRIRRKNELLVVSFLAFLRLLSPRVGGCGPLSPNTIQNSSIRLVVLISGAGSTKAPSTPLSFVCNAKPKWSKVKQIHHTNSQLEAPCLRPPPSLPRLTGVRESQGSQGGPRPRLAGEHLGHHPPSSSFPPAFRIRRKNELLVVSFLAFLRLLSTSPWPPLLGKLKGLER